MNVITHLRPISTLALAIAMSLAPISAAFSFGSYSTSDSNALTQSTILQAGPGCKFRSCQ